MWFDRQPARHVLVVVHALWRPDEAKEALHRWFVGFGLLAVATALIAIPAGIALASAKSDTVAITNGSGDSRHCIPTTWGASSAGLTAG